MFTVWLHRFVDIQSTVLRVVYFAQKLKSQKVSCPTPRLTIIKLCIICYEARYRRLKTTQTPYSSAANFISKNSLSGTPALTCSRPYLQYMLNMLGLIQYENAVLPVYLCGDKTIVWPFISQMKFTKMERPHFILNQGGPCGFALF